MIIAIPLFIIACYALAIYLGYKEGTKKRSKPYSQRELVDILEDRIKYLETL